MLNKKSIEILKLLNSCESLELSDIENKITSKHSILDALNSLDSDGYIQNIKEKPSMTIKMGQPVSYTPKTNIFKIMPKGQAYLEFIPRDRFRFYFPIVISIIALLLSAISLHLQLVR